MFDVYLNEKRDRLLVIARAQPIPVVENAGRWRKKKGTLAVSDEIKPAVRRDGFYCRKLQKTTRCRVKIQRRPLPLGDLVETITRLLASSVDTVSLTDRPIPLGPFDALTR
jgi:hypothetical protein